jgi:hypothetical protein
MSDKPNFEIVRPALVPDPEETLDRNSGAAAELKETTKKPTFRETLNNEADRAEKEKDERILRADQAGQSVLDEANRGEEAWHDAMKNRRNETRTETVKREQGQTIDEIDNLRNGNIDGKPRENSPEDLAMAAEIRSTADDIRLERATEEKSKKEPAPTVPAEPEAQPESHDRLADLPNLKNA